MSAGTVYWILKLDNVVTAATAMTILSWMVGFVCLAIHVIERCAYSPDESVVAMTKRYARILLPLAILSTTVAVFVPDTKQAAMIYVLPRIVNNENVQAEAGSIYALAKEGLMELVKQQSGGDKPDKK